MSLITTSITLPTPAQVTSSIDTSNMDANKTLSLSAGSFEIVDVQISNDGNTWVNLARMMGTSTISTNAYAKNIRVNVINVDYSSTAVLTIAANSLGDTTLASENISIPTSGVGSSSNSVNTSSMGATKTIYCSASTLESLSIEISNDGGNHWQKVATLNGGDIKNISFFAGLMRVTVLSHDFSSSSAIVAITAAQLGAGSDGAITTANAFGINDDLFIYVDATNGNDKNSGSQSHPVQTWDKAISLLPAIWKSNVQIRFMAGTYNINRTAAGGGPVGFHGPSGAKAYSLMFVGAMAAQTIAGTPSASTFSPTSSSSGDTVTCSTLTPTLNQYRGAFIKCITGANAGRMRIITANTTGGQFTVNSPFTFAVATSDTYQVQIPSVNFNITGNYLHSGAGNKRIGYQGIKFTFTSNAFMAMEDYCDVAFAACQMDFTNASSSSAIRTNHRAGIFLDGSDGGGNWGLNNSSSPFLASNAICNSSAAGLYINGALKTITLGGTNMQGYLVSDNLSITQNGSEKNTLNLTNINTKSTRINLANSFVNINGPDSNGTVSIRGVMDTSVSGIALVTLDVGSRGAFSGTDFKNAGGGAGNSSAFVLDNNSFARFFDVGGTNNGTSGASGGVGIEVRHQSAAIYKTASTATTVTGNAGDLRFGTVGSSFGGAQLKSYSTLTSAGGFLDGYGNRINPDTAP